MTEVRYGLYIILVSYETPVAYIDAATSTAYKTKKWYSATTTRHINKFLGLYGYDDAIKVDQQKIGQLMSR